VYRWVTSTVERQEAIVEGRLKKEREGAEADRWIAKLKWIEEMDGKPERDGCLSRWMGA
jgi:hypothetical protein